MSRTSSRTFTAAVAVLALTSLLAPDPAQAQAPSPASHADEPAPGVDLAQLIDLALQQNPEIRAQLHRVDAAAERPAQAFSLPDPMVSLSYRNVGFPGFTLGKEMMSMAGVMFSQQVPTGGKRPTRRAFAERGVDVQVANVETTRRRLVRDLADTYYRLYVVDRSVETLAETQGLLRELESTAAARYSVGEGIQQDVLKAQVELSVLLNRFVQLEQERGSLVTRLNRVAGRAPAAPVTVTPELQLPDGLPDLEALQQEAHSGAAVLQLRREFVRQQEAQVDVARADRKPDLVLSGSWMTRGGLPDLWEVNVGVMWPLRKEQRQDRALAEAVDELDARREDHRDAALAVRADIALAHLELDRSARLSHLYREAIVPQATLSLESALAGYGVGNVDFLTVLDNVVTLLTYELELQRQVASYYAALARIEHQVGRSLGATPDSAWRQVQ